MAMGNDFETGKEMNNNTPANVIENVVWGAQAEFNAVSVDNNVTFEREVGFALQILAGNSYTADIAMRNQRSLHSAIVNVSAIGLSLNPALKQSYLVPRKNSICLDVSYIGMLHLAQISGSILWGQAKIVRQGDVFQLNGFSEMPTHNYNPFSADRGEIVGAYVVVKTCDNDYLTHTMTIADINGIKSRSESVKAGKSSPWNTDFEEMAKKTVIKQASKYWPHRDRLSKAVDYMDTVGGEGLEIKQNGTRTVQIERKPLGVNDAGFTETLNGILTGKYTLEMVESKRDLSTEARNVILDAIASNDGDLFDTLQGVLAPISRNGDEK